MDCLLEGVGGLLIKVVNIWPPPQGQNPPTGRGREPGGDAFLHSEVLVPMGAPIAPRREPSGRRRLARGTTVQRGRDLRRGSRGRAPGRAPCGPARRRG